MSSQKHEKGPENGYVISYLTLRKAVGILGIALPAVLLVVFALMNKSAHYPPSISHYYYTNMGSYFTGNLCAVALFFFAYNGPENVDKRAAMVACLCALGVAFCPANSHLAVAEACPRVFLEASKIRNGFHYGFAGLFFLTLAYFCFFLFTRTGEGEVADKEKRRQHFIYRLCGWLIILSIACIGILSIPAVSELEFAKSLNASTFIFETVALVAFGVSWLVKGKIFN